MYGLELEFELRFKLRHCIDWDLNLDLDLNVIFELDMELGLDLDANWTSSLTSVYSKLQYPEGKVVVCVGHHTQAARVAPSFCRSSVTTVSSPAHHTTCNFWHANGTSLDALHVCCENLARSWHQYRYQSNCS